MNPVFYFTRLFSINKKKQKSVNVKGKGVRNEK